MADVVFHITTRQAWATAQAAGRYEASSLEDEGFIHFSDLAQVVPCGDDRFAGQTGLVLLCVAVERLDAPLRYETSDKGDERFPHLYGALNLDAVVTVADFVEGADGFVLPAEAGAPVANEGA